MLTQGAVHILGEICPRSDPDIAHMLYYLGPLKLKYKYFLIVYQRGNGFGNINFSHVKSP